MVAARKVKSEMAKEVRANAGKGQESTVAKLPGTTDTATVRAAKPVALKTGNNFTGQYLYDRFVNDKAENKADLTKMSIVQQMVEVLDVPAFEECVNGMVKLADKVVKDAIQAARDANNYDSENPTWTIREATARLRTARNHKTVMQNAFGALKYCADELAKKLNGSELSYRMIQAEGSKLLKDRGINWKGEKIQPAEDKAALRQQQTETSAMLAIQKEHPRQPGESLGQYYTRMEKTVEAKMAEIREADTIKNRASMVDKIRAMCGADLPEVLDLLLSGPAPEKAQPSKTKPADIPTAAAEGSGIADKNLH
jgi:hypothetical protein